MKIRDGFVSNSSSASFIVHKDNLSEKDERIIKGIIQKSGSGWSFKETDTILVGYASMDNLDLEKVLRKKKLDNGYAIAFSDHIGWAWQQLIWEPGEKNILGIRE